MTPAGIEKATFRFVAQHLNHCATAVPSQPINHLELRRKLYALCSHIETKPASTVREMSAEFLILNLVVLRVITESQMCKRPTILSLINLQVLKIV